MRGTNLSDSIEKIEGVQKVVSLPKLYNIVKNDSLRRFDVSLVLNQKPQTQTELDSLKQLSNRLNFTKG